MLLVVLVFSLLCVTYQGPVDPKSTPETKCLWKNLQIIGSSKNAIFGHHNDNLNGDGWLDKSGTMNMSDVKTDTGSLPGFIEYNIQKYLNDHKYVNYTALIYESLNNGLMIGWHWSADNPTNNQSNKNTSGDPVGMLLN